MSMLWNMKLKKKKAKQEVAAAKEDYEAALNAKIRIEELEKQIANHTEDHKVTATVNDVAESVERMTSNLCSFFLLPVLLYISRWWCCTR